ncbi:MAG: cytochrome c-type biogenesis protein [Sphingorhabdus sp.]
MKIVTILISFVLLTTPLQAQQDGPAPPLANEQLSDGRQEAAAAALMAKLRCIQCQGQSIADSDAPMAAAMRAEVRQRIAKGESPDSIRDWMIARYGQWVSFEPAMRGGGLFLWLAPALLLLAAAWFARGLFKRRRS